MENNDHNKEEKSPTPVVGCMIGIIALIVIGVIAIALGAGSSLVESLNDHPAAFIPLGLFVLFVILMMANKN